MGLLGRSFIIAKLSFLNFEKCNFWKEQCNEAFVLNVLRIEKYQL